MRTFAIRITAGPSVGAVQEGQEQAGDGNRRGEGQLHGGADGWMERSVREAGGGLLVCVTAAVQTSQSLHVSIRWH